MSCGHLLDLVPLEVDPVDPLTQKNPPGTKHEVDRMIRCGDTAIQNFPRWRPAAILDLIELEIAPFDPPSLKTLP